MAIYELAKDTLIKVEPTSFEAERLKERQDIQRLLRANIEAISPDTLVIAEEYGHFVESNRRIDLLGIDKSANLVVIELKRDDDGGHMELQAIRYAAMVANLTWEQAVSAYKEFLAQTEQAQDAESSLLDFLDWDSPQEDEFGKDVRIVLAARNFSKEITTSVLWVNDMGLDITCVRLNPLRLDERLLLNVEQIIPLPEAFDYQIEVRHKKREERAARVGQRDSSVISLFIDGQPFKNRFKKSDLGLFTVQAVLESGLLDSRSFEFLRQNTSCSFPLIKMESEVKDNERKYRKYRVHKEPELVFEEQGYYVVRNWGIGNIQRFIDEIESRFPTITFSIEAE
ncbi:MULTISPECIES: hypothetical protein [Vibrio]|uniref:DUF91 domain-containing protein n=1 Tax=Vibrio lentus TaxID=136468 RepID=A0A4U2EYY2_9VIBR|nr:MULTISPECIES: hypothetical protein [Vibrio]PTP60824.1 hypothetical protein CWO31_21290 [Vibrio splendidus]TKG07900.1 hypothetical protein FCV91_13825 [Vibrio lentus]